MRKRTAIITAGIALMITGPILAGCASATDPAAPGSSGSPTIDLPTVPPTAASPSASPSASGPSKGGPSVAPSETTASLTISYTADRGAKATEWTLTCQPVGGTHPDGAAACASLAKAGTAPFQPPDPNQMCTQIYGGPQTATVTGTVGSSEVSATFSRVNGCEVARWSALEGLLPKP